MTDFRTLEKAEKTAGDERIAVPDEVSDEICELCGATWL